MLVDIHAVGSTYPLSMSSQSISNVHVDICCSRSISRPLPLTLSYPHLLFLGPPIFKIAAKHTTRPMAGGLDTAINCFLQPTHPLFYMYQFVHTHKVCHAGWYHPFLCVPFLLPNKNLPSQSVVAEIKSWSVLSSLIKKTYIGG